jgi:hypothetical protein
MAKLGSNLSINLSAIIYCEDGVWLAHCLELDIVAEGKDANDAVKSLISLCDLQIKVALEEGDLESIFRPAPPGIWKLFVRGKDRCISEKRGTQKRRGYLKAPVDRFEAREMALA